MLKFGVKVLFRVLGWAVSHIDIVEMFIDTLNSRSENEIAAEIGVEEIRSQLEQQKFAEERIMHERKSRYVFSDDDAEMADIKTKGIIKPKENKDTAEMDSV